jgi:hypothetical protein
MNTRGDRLFVSKIKIMIKFEIKAVKHRRWMRCINADNLEDYVDISIGSGSNNKERQDVLEIADLIGGDWRGAFFEKGVRVKYDYYYLYYRDSGGVFDPTGNGEYADGTAMGGHRNGDYVRVNINTNKIVEQIPFDEWGKKLSRAAE